MDDVVSTRMRSATLLFMLIWTKSPNVTLDQTSTRVDNSLISPQKNNGSFLSFFDRKSSEY